MSLLVYLAAIISVSSSMSYDKFSLYRFVPKNKDDVRFLTDIENSVSDKYDFWTFPRDVNISVDILIPPQQRENFKKMIFNNSMNYEVLMENVQHKIDEETRLNAQLTKITKNGMSWNAYHRTNQIYIWLYDLTRQYPGIVSIIEGGKTYQGRKITGVKVSFQSGNEKRGVWLHSLIHSREWISGATTTFILNQLLTSKDPKVREVAENHDWYIFPVVNPDGYEYSHTTDRLWRKNRRKIGSCYGVDLNRNWGYKWNTGDRSNINPCSDVYVGTNAFSEIETKSLSAYFSTIAHKLKAFISFHSYSQMILLPYGHTKEHLDNYDEVKSIGLKAAKKLAQRYGTKYVVGNIAEIIYPATGNTMDWVKATFNVPIALTFELRDTGKNGFILPASQIIPTGLETLDSLVEILKEGDRYYSFVPCCE